MTRSTTKPIGVVIVAYGNPEEVKLLVDCLEKQKGNEDEIVVVDNHAKHETALLLEGHPSVNVIIKSKNVGFAGGCNKGVSALSQNIYTYFFLNPDTMPNENTLENIRTRSDDRFDAWMPLLVLPDGRVNSAGNVVHISGMSWVDGYLSPAVKYEDDMPLTVISGACLVISAKWWKRVGGLADGYFMYHEDTDLSTRLILLGARLGLVPSLRVQHNYDYKKGDHKWVYIERNRPLYIIRTWPLGVIMVLSIQLIGVELGLWLVALLQGRLRSKARAAVLTLRGMSWALRTRGQIQKTRRISSYEFLQTLVYKLDTPLLGGLAKNKLIEAVFRWYYRIASGVLKAFSVQR